MGKIDDACRDVVSKVEGAVACGVVDLDTGMLLGIYNNAQYTQTLTEVVAAATMDLFRGANVRRGEQMVRVMVRNNSWKTVMAAISSHPAHLKVTLEFQRCQ